MASSVTRVASASSIHDGEFGPIILRCSAAETRSTSRVATTAWTTRADCHDGDDGRDQASRGQREDGHGGDAGQHECCANPAGRGGVTELDERGRREGILDALRPGDAVSRYDRQRGQEQRADRHDQDARAWCPPLDPEHEAEEQRRRDCDQIALRDVLDVTGREGGDLHHQQRDVGAGGGEERRDVRIALAAPQRQDDEQGRGEQRNADGDQRDAGDMPDDLFERLPAESVDSSPSVAYAPSMSAHEKLSRVARAINDSTARATNPTSSGSRRIRVAFERVINACPTAATTNTGSRINACSRTPPATTTAAMKTPCRHSVGSSSDACQREERDRDERVVERLAHQQPRVRQRRDGERERRGRQRAAVGEEAPAPEEDGHRGERHHERLHGLRERGSRPAAMPTESGSPTSAG